MSQQSKAARFELPHIPGLDGVRGLAISMVLAFHLFEIPYESLGPAILSRVFSYGWLGVDLFFVLSGFLVTLMLHNLGRAPGALRTFFRRRALRIVPAYVATLLIAYLVVGPGSASLGLSLDPPNILWFLLAAQNYLFATDRMGGFSGLSHYWSLAVEIQFYLLWPMLVYGRSPLYIQRLCAALFAVSLAFKIGFLSAAPDLWQLSYALPITRIDAFAAGAFAAMAYCREAICMPRLGLGLPFLCVLAGGIYMLESTPLGNHARVVLLTPAAAVTFAWSIMWVTDSRSANSPIRHLLESRALRSLGKYSYGMYLLHFIALDEFQKATRSVAHAWDVDLNLALTFGGLAVGLLTWCFARLMFTCVEEPFLKLR